MNSTPHRVPYVAVKGADTTAVVSCFFVFFPLVGHTERPALLLRPRFSRGVCSGHDDAGRLWTIKTVLVLSALLYVLLLFHRCFI